MNYLQALEAIHKKGCGAIDIDTQHIYRALYRGHVEILHHFQKNAEARTVVDVFDLGITEKGHSFVRDVQEAIK
jgi:hypothetical protein